MSASSSPLGIYVCAAEPDGRMAWRDAMELGQVVSADRRELQLAMDLPAGVFKGVIRTRRGQFPMETVHLPLLEWPTLRRVPCGPFDFDHTENTMTVPCFHVRVDDEPAELAWFDIPSADMVEQRYFETAFGFAAGQAGRHTLRLTWRDGETRLTWDDVAEIRLATDERQPVPCPARAGAGLWADATRWQQLRDNPTPLQAALIANLLDAARTGLDGTYTHRTLLVALLHRLGEAGWRDELRTRALGLAERRDWGFHGATGELGCDNDRDAGLRLMELSAVLAWAADAFTAEEESRLVAKVRRHARILYRFTVVQKAYWPDTTIEAHGLGGWVGLAAAAALLRREDAEARRWLDWCYGNFLRNAQFLPRDGFNPWPVFNSQWAVYLLALFERLTGEPVRVANTFFDRYAPLLAELHAMQWLPPMTQATRGFLREEVAVAGYLGARNADAAAQAASAGWARAVIAAGGHVPPLALLFMDGREPATPVAPEVPRTLRTRSGHVSTLDRAAGHLIRLDFTCGSPQGPENAARLNRYTQFHNNMGLGGGYTLLVDGTAVVAGPPGSYDYRTGYYPLVSVDGGGHIMEHRYGGFCLRPEQQPYIRCVEDEAERLYVQAELRPVYRPELDLCRATRHLWLLRGRGIVVVLDEYASGQPRAYAHHLPTPGRFESGPGGAWRAEHGGQTVHITPLMPAGCAGATGELAYVPTYSLGLNAYKSRDWQPEVHALFQRPPSYQTLIHRPAVPVQSFHACVVLSLSPVEARLDAEPDGACAIVIGDCRIRCP